MEDGRKSYTRNNYIFRAYFGNVDSYVWLNSVFYKKKEKKHDCM